MISAHFGFGFDCRSNRGEGVRGRVSDVIVPWDLLVIDDGCCCDDVVC
jgi:hypothetical protein